MSRYTVTVRCVHPGCDARGHFAADTRRDERDTRHRYSGKWRCSRHTNMDGILSPTNTRVVTEVSAGPSVKYPNLAGLYWSNGSGFVFGNGWKAWADDFPPGTRIRVTAEVILPDEPEASGTTEKRPKDDE